MGDRTVQLPSELRHLTMKPTAHRTSRHRHAAPVVLMPPDLQMMGSLPFAASDFTALDTWLAEEGWPPGRMDIATLEGYLVALLVWPIALSAGAWLPLIWGIRGWKVAAKIATPATYDRFVLLLVGFLQDLERRLTTCPRRRTFVLEHDSLTLSARYFAGSAWATGFMTALHENSTGLGSRSVASRSAVERIARYASLRSTQSSALVTVAADLSAQVAILMEERPSRGALGPLTSSLSRVARVHSRAGQTAGAVIA
jgi:yecA family protein